MTDLIDQHREELLALCQRRGVKSLAVFGSVARGDLKPNSDVDLLIEFKPDAGVGLLGLQDIQGGFEAILGRQVDIASKEILRNPYRRAHDHARPQARLCRLKSATMRIFGTCSMRRKTP